MLELLFYRRLAGFLPGRNTALEVDNVEAFFKENIRCRTASESGTTVDGYHLVLRQLLQTLITETAFLEVYLYSIFYMLFLELVGGTHIKQEELILVGNQRFKLIDVDILLGMGIVCAASLLGRP